MINGAERVIVSQLVRLARRLLQSRRRHGTRARPINATIIPNRGAWIEFETDNGYEERRGPRRTIGVRDRQESQESTFLDLHPRALLAPILAWMGQPGTGVRSGILKLLAGTWRQQTSSPAAPPDKGDTMRVSSHHCPWLKDG